MIVQKEIEEYIRTLSKFKDKSLEGLETYAKNNHVPIIEPEVAKFLQMIVRLKKPIKVLELGTAIGYSSIIIKLANRNSEIVSIEKNPEMVKIANKNIIDFGFDDSVEVIESDALDYLNKCEEKFDFIFIDAAKGQYMRYFKASEKLLNPKGIILCDNVLFKGLVCDEEALTKRHRNMTIVRRLNSFLEYITKLKDFETSIIPIDDGMSISYKI
ncbi:O-methyltransferase [Lagierella sp.]|uniref:O-methyltransferase n=1 Tax=Lagierella sp. TaxID=2849657 RepID=UPI002606822B|nr:O-methyltransferase [Lagierella sp.]